MIVFKKIDALRQWLDNQPEKQAVIGFVPTMGALHDGHSSLIKASKNNGNLVVCSIFVNPAQFNDPADFEKYPVSTSRDIEKLIRTGCDVLFIPSVNEIYPPETGSVRKFDLGFLENILEGTFRPGHFQGVCLVVDRLLDIVQPDQLYLGQKDYQQCMVIARLIEIMHKKESIRLTICPTLREPDGLAMSSRNLRLDPAQREQAVAIFRALSYINDHLQKGSTDVLIEKASQLLLEKKFRIDYISIADAVSLQPVADWDGKQKIVALAAAYLGEVRLIDNFILN